MLLLPKKRLTLEHFCKRRVQILQEDKDTQNAPARKPAIVPVVQSKIRLYFVFRDATHENNAKVRSGCFLSS